jgi:hypothetical protein
VGRYGAKRRRCWVVPIPKFQMALLSLSLSDVVHFDIFPWLLAARLKHGKLVM